MTRIILWTLFALLAIDVIISFVIETPKNNIKPSKLAQYFDYGRSIESKLFRRVSNDNKSADIITKAGWYKSNSNTLSKKTTDNNRKRIYIYGMSFSNRIGRIISKRDRSLDVRMFAGPGAPLNHSYGYYQSHRPHQKGDTIILGILASSLPMINTLTHMTSNFEGPAAHFYPRYRINSNNQLLKTELPIKSLTNLRTIMKDKIKWRHVKEKLEKEDSYYNSAIFLQNYTDKSVYFRLLKRAWGQRHKLKITGWYHDQLGFKNTERLIDVSQLIVRKFVQQVRDDGANPIIILFNDRGFDDHLHTILKPILIEDNIQYYSTHRDFPARELTNFIPDGHFTHEIDESIAIKILKKYIRPILQ